MKKINSNSIKVGGLEFKAVRCKSPMTHWRPKLPNGVVVGFGMFKGDSPDVLFDDIKYYFNLICRGDALELKRRLSLN